MPAPVDGANAGHVLWGADSLGQQSVPDLPREHRGVFMFVPGDGVHHFGGSYFGFGSADDTGFDGTRLIISEI